jgi:diguanylate cyclase (GGDEF)-like protein
MQSELGIGSGVSAGIFSYLLPFAVLLTLICGLLVYFIPASGLPRSFIAKRYFVGFFAFYGIAELLFFAVAALKSQNFILVLGQSFFFISFLLYSWAFVAGIRPVTRAEIIGGLFLAACAVAWSFYSVNFGVELRWRIISFHSSVFVLVLLGFVWLFFSYMNYDAFEHRGEKVTLLSLGLVLCLLLFNISLALMDVGGYEMLPPFSLVVLILLCTLAIFAYFLHDYSQELYEEASTDPMTGLLNRRYFYVRVREKLRMQQRKTPMCILVCDIDSFKGVNDGYGHLIGDQVICGVADVLKAGIRDVDICARFGGDEFVIFLPRAEAGDVILVAERLREQIEGLFFIGEEEEVFVTASFGVAPILMANDLDDAVRKADRALYRAKSKGRNCVEVVYD